MTSSTRALSGGVHNPDHFTDLGNARRLVKAYGHNLRYCPQGRRWLVWDGRRWAPDDTLHVMQLAKTVVTRMYADATTIGDDDRRHGVIKHARRSENEARLRAMVTLAQSEPGIPAKVQELDREPWLLNVLNGTIDMRTGELRDHRRADLITKLAPVAYDPAATCPRWDAFLNRIFADDQKLIAFVQRAAGYCLSGTASERAIFVLHGNGRNGKSTLLETLRAIFGDYAMATPVETLLVKRTGGIPNDLARLNGARLVTASEAESGARLAEAHVKQLTGRDMMPARFLYGEFFEFRPTFGLWLATNHKPVIHGTDPAIWDRVRLIPFTVRIPESEQDKGLLERLHEELPGILRWLVDGCLAWQRDGLDVPPAVEEATAAYQAEMDPLTAFIEECCVIAPTVRATIGDLWKAYVVWSQDTGRPALGKEEFDDRLTEQGYSPEKGTKGIRIRPGLGLQPEWVARVAEGGGESRKSSNRGDQ
jgi:putative DNA primase/helicase